METLTTEISQIKAQQHHLQSSLSNITSKLQQQNSHQNHNTPYSLESQLHLERIRDGSLGC